MNALDNLLTPKRVMCQVEAASRKRVFELVAQQIADDAKLTEDSVYTQLLAREKLGSTALGGGVAIPHCRVAGCKQPLGCLVTLASGVDFDAPDSREVDLLFVLLVPEEATQTHLDLLAEIARRFSSAQYCAGLRGAESASQLLFAATHSLAA